MDLSLLPGQLEFRRTACGVAPALRALWLDAKGDFDGAHCIAQDIHDADGARVHAYLHRKEGDLSNAGYWYRRAGCELFRGSL